MKSQILQHLLDLAWRPLLNKSSPRTFQCIIGKKRIWCINYILLHSITRGFQPQDQGISSSLPFGTQLPLHWPRCFHVAPLCAWTLSFSLTRGRMEALTECHQSPPPQETFHKEDKGKELFLPSPSFLLLCWFSCHLLAKSAKKHLHWGVSEAQFLNGAKGRSSARVKVGSVGFGQGVRNMTVSKHWKSRGTKAEFPVWTVHFPPSSHCSFLPSQLQRSRLWKADLQGVLEASSQREE